ncbi:MULTISPECIES: replication protein [Citrobacter]|uniref:replication protein n=1 Tax=Citrobacter freundii TaxID=546 RepID=UPI002550BB82|nr:replication protein [Citrobacter freundii]HEI8797977.1 replication protein [Citrobacter freundii]HEI8803295.1 replication protein [Citrobacter freundii]
MGVVKLAEYQPQREVLESKVASLDDGYMRIATSIGKLKPKLKLAGREHQVLDAVIYCTFGWNKSEDKVTNTYLADVTGLDDSDVAAALNVLAERRIINLRKVGGFKLVSVNVSIDKWVLNKTPKKSPKRLGGTTQNVGRKEVLNWAKSPDTLNSLTKDNINTPQPPEGECVGQEEKPVSKKTPIDYQAVLSAYNTTLGDRLPQAEALNDKRRRAIKRLLTELKEPTVEAVENYFAAFAERAPKFYFGENDRGWRASFDYLLRSDTLLKTREKAL